MSQQAVSADIIPNSAVGIFPPSDTAQTESEIAEMPSWDQANRGKKLGLIWRNKRKISQTINDYLFLPFFLLIILWGDLRHAHLLHFLEVQAGSLKVLDPTRFLPG